MEGMEVRGLSTCFRLDGRKRKLPCSRSRVLCLVAVGLLTWFACNGGKGLSF